MAQYENLFTVVQATGPLHHGVPLGHGNSPRTGDKPALSYLLGKLGNAQIGNGRLFTTITAVVVGGTSLSGGQGSVLQTVVGVLIVVVLSNGMVLMGVPPSVQIGVQGLMIIAAVALSINRKLMKIIK